MRIRQRKARGAVIKGRRRPRGRSVTGRAVRNRKYRGGRRVVRVSGLLPGRQMAAGISASIWRRRQVVIVVDVAGRASNSRVRPGQRKVCWRPGVIKGRADPAVKRVTHLAVLRKLAGHVIRIGGLLEIRPVTGNAGGGQPLELAHGRTLVAVLTLHRGMGTEQRKAVLVFLHLLYGGVPALHCVALRAVRAHLSLVHIGVAVLAVLARVRKNRLHVALRALHFFVHAAQRILGLVVVEFRVRLDRAPRCRGVAIFAREVQRRAMRTSGSRPTLLLGRLRCLGARPIIASGIFRDGEGQQRPQNDLEHCQRKFPLSDRRRVPPPGKGPLNFQHSLLFPVPRQLYWRLVLDHRTLLPGVVRQTPTLERTRETVEEIVVAHDDRVGADGLPAAPGSPRPA